jgi:chemotaxis protein methyltransferase CheR
MITAGELHRARIEIREVAKELYNLDLKGSHHLFLERRLNHLAMRYGIRKGSVLLDFLLNKPDMADEIRKEFNIGYTRLYRDPAFFLKTVTLIRKKIEKQGIAHIWHAGCSKGHEVYSLIILLEEAGILNECRIYATDINPEALSLAKKGIVPLTDIQQGIRDYLSAGGRLHLGRHFTVSHHSAILKSGLLNKIKFAKHDLSKDAIFQKFDFIFCRNVFIYYQPFFQKKLLSRLTEALHPGGFLGMTPGESIDEMGRELKLKSFDNHLNIYQKEK